MSPGQPMMAARFCSAFTVALVFLALCPLGGRAQLDPVARQRAEQAVVQIAFWVVGDRAGEGYEDVWPSGSGTFISESGLILTNNHVVDAGWLPDRIEAIASETASQGRPVTLAPATDDAGDLLYRILVTDQNGVLEPAYTARLVARDEGRDLAILQVTGDAFGIPLASPALPIQPVPLGDSNSVQRADQVHVLGYPADLGLFYTDGNVSSIATEPGIVGRAWIYTDAKAAPGISGGAALDAAGRLIGIPTAVVPPECRADPLSADSACIQAGDSFARLRPINLIRPMLRELAPEMLASMDAAQAAVTPEPASLPQPAAASTATATPSPTATPPAPTATPLPTSTAVPAAPSAPTPTPTAVPAAPPAPTPTPPPVSVIFSGDVPLGHVDCFRIEDSGTRTFDEAAAALGDTDEVRQLLRDWGWRMNAYRIYACDGPPTGRAGWIDISVHVFGSAEAAREAVDYYATQRVNNTQTQFVPAPNVGDYSVAVSGPTSNGTEFTLYSSHGPMLMRATGVSPDGVPITDVTSVALEVWSLQD